MLTELYCDKFRDDDSVRSPIQFHKGLNIVLGGQLGDNSVGKTTFLQIIDFAFGGKTYIEKNKELIEKVGSHDIRFSFLFNQQLYYFVRGTTQPHYVWKCNDLYEKQERMKVGDFCSFLQSSYNMKDINSFRDSVSPFCRIFGKASDNVDRILQNSNREATKKGVLRLFDLFNYGFELRKSIARIEEIDNKRQFMKLGSDYGYFPKMTEKKYEENSKKLVKLKAEKDLLVSKFSIKTCDLDSEKMRMIAQGQSEIIKLKRQKYKIQTSLSINELNNPEKYFVSQNEIENLKTFFPNLNCSKIEEIEKFHQGIYSLLKDECKKEKDNLEHVLEVINGKIELLEKECLEITNISSMPQMELIQYASLEEEIRRIEMENKAYADRKKLDVDKKETKESLMNVFSEFAPKIQTEIQNYLHEIVLGELKDLIKVPSFALDDISHYKLKVPIDQGTGTIALARFLFDFCMINKSCLPLMMSDSVWLSQMENARYEKMLELSSKCKKQVFISADKNAVLSNEKWKSKIVLELSKGHELFGIDLRKPDSNPR